MYQQTLQTVHRQENPEEAALLSRIRTGTQTAMDLRRLNERVGPPPYTALVLSPLRRTVRQLNSQRVSSLGTEEYIFSSWTTGTMRSLHGALPQTIRLRRGCRVIVKRNSRREVKGNTQVVVNGDTGCFLGLDKYDRLCVLLDRTSEICYLKRERIADTRPRVELKEDGSPCVRDQVLGTLEQYPVDLGYAMTIHASQGSTLQRVHLCLPRARPFTPNMLYVALSRAPSLSRITLSRPITDRDIVSTVKGETHHQQYDLNDD